MFIDLLAGRKGTAFFIASKTCKKYGTWSFVNRWQYNSGLPSLYVFTFRNNSLDAPFSGNSCVLGIYFLVGFRSSRSCATRRFPRSHPLPITPVRVWLRRGGLFFFSARGWRTPALRPLAGSGGLRRFRPSGTRGRCKAADCRAPARAARLLALPQPPPPPAGGSAVGSSSADGRSAPKAC